MSDPIRDALREAEKGRTTAEKVAAFLRHYSKRKPTPLIYGPVVADDVERAAKEGA